MVARTQTVDNTDAWKYKNEFGEDKGTRKSQIE